MKRIKTTENFKTVFNSNKFQKKQQQQQQLPVTFRNIKNVSNRQRMISKLQKSTHILNH